MQFLSTWFVDSSGSSFLNLWLDAALKATVLLLAALACTAVMRRSSAAVRHRTWCLTFAGLIALPYLSFALPAWRIPVLPPAPAAVVVAETMTEAAPSDAAAVRLPPNKLPVDASMPPIADWPQQALPPAMIITNAENGATAAVPIIPSMTVPVAPSTTSLGTAAAVPESAFLSLWLIVWVGGCALVALPLIASVLHGIWISLRAAPMTDPIWTGMLREVQTRLLLTRRVALVELDRPLIPMTWGVLRPVVLVPKLAREWSERLRRFVLLHELAHVKRWDVPIQLLGRIACAMYWFHPLAWYALRRLRIEREHACDDCVVTAGERPSDYAEQLLQIARTCRPAGFATVAVAMARSSHLEGRIRAMFDRARSHVPLSVHAARMLFLAAAILVTTVAVIRPGTRNIAEANGPARDDSTTAAASPAGDSQPPGSNTNAAVAAEGTPQEHVFTYHGRVVDEDGAPVNGATVYVFRSGWKELWEPEHEELARATPDHDGCFEVTFTDPLTTALQQNPRQQSPTGQHTYLFAAAEGYAPAIVNTETSLPDTDVLLKLEQESVPIQGRVLDLEGRPVAGANVHFWMMFDPASGAVNDWLARVAQLKQQGRLPRKEDVIGMTAVQSAADFPLRNSMRRGLPGLPSDATTDAEGRFQFANLGTDRLAILEVEGPGIVPNRINVVTRPMPAVDALALNYPGIRDDRYYGGSFDYIAEPSRPVLGTIRDRETGQPLAGVTVNSRYLAGSIFPAQGMLSATTDDAGRFRIDGLPKGQGNRLSITPRADQPYFVQDLDMPDTDGVDPVELTVDMPRGVLITGRLTDVQTGKPVAAQLCYTPLLDNLHAEAYENYDPRVTSLLPRHDEHYFTDKDGNFRLVAIPGRGILAARCQDAGFVPGYGFQELAELHSGEGNRLKAYDYCSADILHTLQLVEIEAGASEIKIDLQVDSGASVTVQTVDESGTPVSGVRVNGESTSLAFRGVSRTPEVTIRGLHADWARRVIFHHPERQLGQVLLVRGEGQALSDSRVTLLPCATITGRLVRADGSPVATAEVEVRFDAPDEALLLTSKSLQNLSAVAVSADGTFRYEGIPPGDRCRMIAQSPEFRFKTLIEAFTVPPGQTIELGDVNVDGELPISIAADPEDAPAADLGAGREGSAQATPQRQQDVTLRGRIVDANGEPVPEAGIYWMTSRVPLPMSLEDVEFRQRAATGADGRFETTLSWSDIPGTALEIPVIVYKPGYAVAGSMLNRSATPEDLALTLVADSPLHGRIIDTEGQPVVGARVALNGVYASSRGLDPFLTAWKQEWGMAPERLEQHLHTPGAPLGATTDKEGRFELRAVGKEQVALIEVTAPAISALQLWVVNRDGFDAAPYNDAATGRIPARLRIPGQIPTLTGPDFTQVAESSLSIEGTVFTGESRTPVADANVFALTGYDAGANAKSDAQGRFRLQGLPRGRELLVTIRPAGEESDLLKRTIPVSAPPGETTVRVDVELRRGVVLTGRVVDPTTGAGVQSGIRIVPLPGNSHVDRPGYDGYQRDHTMSSTAADGRFRIVAVPGPIVLMAQADAGSVTIEGEPACPFRQATFDDADRAHVPVTEEGGGRYFRTATNSIEMLSTENAVRYFDLPPDSEAVETELRVDRGKTVEVQVVDEQGAPVRDAIGAGLADHWPITYQLHEPRCTVFALGADRPRTVLFLHRDRQLVGSLTLKGDESSPITVKLTAAGTITGRATDESGAPIIGTRVTLNYAGGAASELQRFLQLDQPEVKTGNDGRFEIPSVVPGQKFAIDFQRDDGAYFRAQLSEEQKQLDRGGDRDYGNIVVRKLQ